MPHLVEDCQGNGIMRPGDFSDNELGKFVLFMDCLFQRDYKNSFIRAADASTGDVKVLIEERLNTGIETRPLLKRQERHGGPGQSLSRWNSVTRIFAQP